MSFIIASNQNQQTKLADNFDSSAQIKKQSSHEKSSFSDRLDKAQSKLSNERTSSQDVSVQNSKNENVKNTASEKFDNLESYGRNEKERDSSENLEKTINTFGDKGIENSSNTENTNDKKVNLYSDSLELLQLEVAPQQQLNVETEIDLEALMTQIGSLIEQINAIENIDTSLVADVNDIESILQEIGLSLESVVNSANMSNVKNVQSDLPAMVDRLNTLLQNMSEKLALVENVEPENIEMFEAVKSLTSKINETVANDEAIKNVVTSETVSTAKVASVDNEMFVDNLEAAKEHGLETKANRKLERTENSASQSSASVHAEKSTEFTIVQAKDGVIDIMDNPLNSRSSVAGSQPSNASSGIDIINKFQDMLTTIVERAKLTIADGKTDMIMSLRPENLGNVRMKMTVEGDSLIAKIFVDSSEVKDIFTKNLDTIISSLKELNVNIEGFDVSLSQNGENAGFGEQEDGEFVVDSNNTGFGVVDMDTNESVAIATQLFPERQLNIVI